MSGGADARLFAAVELPRELALTLQGWAREAAAGLGAGRGAPGLRVLEPDSLHLTLCFLGSRPAEEIDGLVAALEQACDPAPELELSLGAPVWLPPRRPRALAVEIHDGAGALARLQAAIARALEEDGPDRSPSRRFRPHVTVARIRAGLANPTQIVLPATPAAGFPAERVALMRSWLEPQGARYESQGGVTLVPGPA
jgi:RNA 2',3'-cyclic 3'-phosphodiesterase